MTAVSHGCNNVWKWEQASSHRAFGLPGDTDPPKKKKKCTREQTVRDGKEYPKGSNSILKELMIKKLTQAWWSAKAGLQKAGPTCTGTL